MMNVRQQADKQLHLPYAGIASRLRKVGPFSVRLIPPCLALLMALLMPQTASAAVISLSMSSAPGGVVLSGTNPSYSAGYGNVNSLGVGTPGAGITIISTGVSGGVIYSTNINFVITGLVVPHTAIISA